MLATDAPVFRLKPRTASMSATQSVSPTMAMPFGAFRVTLPRPPATNLSESTEPSALIRLMKPLLSLALGSPFTLETESDALVRIPANRLGVLQILHRSDRARLGRRGCGCGRGAAVGGGGFLALAAAGGGQHQRSDRNKGRESDRSARHHGLQEGWSAGVGNLGTR